MARTIKLLVEYDGTNYQGWQVQPDVPTIQGELERAIHKITGEKVRVHGAGRTDAGVHALGQVANFPLSHPMPCEKMRLALNAVLPRDIVLHEVEEADGTFHARYSARLKRYRYLILNRPFPSALDRNTVVHVARPLDVDAMREAAKGLVGTFDFSSFACNSGEEENPTRTVTDISVSRQGDYITIEIEAVSFLYKMARSIVATLLDVGKGKLKPGDILGILGARDRSKSSATAPAKGLCLIRVEY
ncbi:MAG: tRNA pseudouridine(38-40) synthase TruA [Candidatus Aureabacteria bacterium]|nr:tRNA pseudouridine(38-40) synthase TruA [Candidatus Auribacterota bacterium]